MKSGVKIALVAIFFLTLAITRPVPVSASTGFLQSLFQSFASLFAKAPSGSLATAITGVGSGLEAYYAFEEGGGGTSADSSGNLHTISLLNGATWSSNFPPSLSVSTHSILLDGVDDYAKSNNAVSFGTSFSASAWVFVASRPASQDGIVSTAYYNSFALGTRYNGGILFTVFGQPTFSNSTIPLNTWTHIAATFDGTNAKIYINGTLDSDSGDISPYINKVSTNDTVKVGSYYDGGIASLNGLIDDVRVYSRALSGGDVTDIYAATGVIPPDTRAPGISSVASSPALNSATITWTTDEGADSTVSFGPDTSYGLTPVHSSAIVTSHSSTLSGLSSGTTYHFKVSSADASGNPSDSTDYIFTTATPDFTAPVISAISATPTLSGATVTWNTDDSSDSQIEYGNTSSYTSSSTLYAAAVTSHSVALSGLTSGATYHYRVLSRNGTNILSVSSDKTFTILTPGPTAPGYVSAKGVAPDQVNIVWYQSTDSDGTITDYTIYRDGVSVGTVAARVYLDAYRDTAVHTFEDRSVTASRTYSYYVVAHDSSNVYSPHSVTVTATTPFGTPALIPSSRLTDWTPGVAVGVPGGIPNRTHLLDVTQAPYNADKTGIIDSTPAIQAAVNAAVSGDVVYLPAGRYKLNTTIYSQNKSNFTIRGAGMENTILDSYGGNINFRGVTTPRDTQAVTSGATRGSNQVTVTNGLSFGVGDLIQFTTLNDFDLPVIGSNGGSRLRNQVSKVTAVSGNTVTFTPAIIGNFDPANTDATALFGVESFVGAEDFTIIGNNRIQTGIVLDGTYGSWVKNVKVLSVNNYGISISWGVNCELRHNNIDYSHEGTSGGGLLTGLITKCLFEDNIFKSTPDTQIDFGSVGNVFGYNYMGGGSTNTNHSPHNDYNLYEGNVTGEFKSDGYYGGESNATFFRNYMPGGFFSFKRFSRDFTVIGNITGLYSFGQPNIGNGSSTKIAQPSQGVYWLDWNKTIGPAMTGSFTKVSNSAGTFHFDSHADAVRMFIHMSDLWGGACVSSPTFMTCDSPSSLDWGQGRDDNKFRFTYIHSLDLTTDIADMRVTYPSGIALPPTGTSAALWPRSEGFQELDMDVALTTILKNNYQNGTIASFEALTGGETMPNSLYRSASKPGFFGTLAWPAFNPASPGAASLDSIPAGYRYNHPGMEAPGVTGDVVVLPPTDTTLPVVSLTSPSAGIISGTVTLSATASDNVAVAGVQFKLDGINIGGELTVAPYSGNWNTVGVSNGAHTLTAVARDTSNNTKTSNPVNITISNVAGPTPTPTPTPTPDPVTGVTPVTTPSGGGPSPVGTFIPAVPQPSPTPTPTPVVPIVPPTNPTNPSSWIFTKSLSLGMKDAQVMTLQKYLNTNGFSIAVSGPGSLGKETTYFGPATKTALIKFQKAKGIVPPSGLFGPLTRGFVTGKPVTIAPIPIPTAKPKVVVTPPKPTPTVVKPKATPVPTKKPSPTPFKDLMD